MTATVTWAAERAVSASGLLRAFNDAEVLAAADVHVATTLGRLGGEADERVLLAAALAVRAVRSGSVCVDLTAVRGVEERTSGPDADSLPWPDSGQWRAACRASGLVGEPHGDGPEPLRLVGDLLYLDRYWRQEEVVRLELARRSAADPPPVDPQRLSAALDRAWSGRGRGAPESQRLAVAAAVTGWLTVIAGGPGTGKTTTVGRLLEVLDEVLDSPRVALAAPTGRAAARLGEAVGREATTLHRLLGWRPGSRSRFRHDRHSRLPYDVVVVDETSMVSLTLMSRLLEAVRPETRVVLVGDPDQLTSVEAGAVLGDLVARPQRPAPDARERLLLELLPDDVDPPEEVVADLRCDVVRLQRTYRFSGAVAELAEAVRAGDADTALAVLRGGDPSVALVDTDLEAPGGPPPEGLREDAVAAGVAVWSAATAGDAGQALHALQSHRLLCAHRSGPYGARRWAEEVQRWLAAAVDGYGSGGPWYVGRSLLVTANDPEIGLSNGDVGVVVAGANGGGTASVVAAFPGREGPVLRAPSRVPAVETLHATTVHKSQGSQYDRVSLLLPPEESPLLSRELLYTAVTRATSSVRLLGSEAAVRAAVARPVARASGLRVP